MYSRIKKAAYSKIKAIVNIHKVLTNSPLPERLVRAGLTPKI